MYVVTLTGVCFEPAPRGMVVFKVEDKLHVGHYMLTTITSPDLLAPVRQLLPWPELVDLALNKAQSEFERLGAPAKLPGAAHEGRYSPALTFECDLDLLALQDLFTQAGGQCTTGFFPVPGATTQ